MTRPLLSVFLLASLIGCATGAPPSAIERSLYSVTTNWHTQVQPVAVIDSNRTVTATNYVTNVFATFELHEKEVVKATVGAVGAVGTTFGFGAGGAIATILLGLYGAWARFRNAKSNKLNIVLSQGIETAREIIAATSAPAVEEKFVERLKSDQVKAGVKAEGEKVSSEKVDPVAAKDAAAVVLKPTP